MQVFELYFNPKKETKISESFHYKPKDAYEGKLGRIYMIGEIDDPDSKDHSFLQNIFHITRESYYKDTSLSPEKALAETLKELNNFIKEREYDGKLDVALLASKNFSIYLSKIGRPKIFLMNNNSLKDIGEELEDKESNLFCNMITGKMKKSDRLLILTTEIFTFFKKSKLLENIASDSLSEESMEKISSLQQEKFPEVTGIALIVDHAVSLKEKQTKVLSSKRNERFSFKKVLFDNTLAILLKIKPSKVKFSLPSKNFFPLKNPILFKKSVFLHLLLLGVIILGSIVIGIEQSIKTSKQREEIISIEEKISLAREEGNLFEMKEALLELESLIKKGKLKEEATKMHSSLKEELFGLTLREDVENLDLIYQIEGVVPGNLTMQNGKLYISFPDQLIEIDLQTKTDKSYPLSDKVTMISSSSNTVTLFSPPNRLFLLENEVLSEITINLAYEGQRYISLSSFFKRPYLLDNSGNIFRYQGDSPTAWIKNEEDVSTEGLSMAIDGSIFIFTSVGEILRYHEGRKEEKINPFVFPEFSKESKIYTSSESPLFVLDSKEGRIAVISKEGILIKQLFNDKFKKSKDLAFDGKKIYLLIDKEVYSLNF